MLRKILVAAIGAAAIFLVIALGLVATDRPRAPEVEGIDFAEAVEADYAGMPDPATFTARDGAALAFRLYGEPATADRIVILVHGSGWHGMQFHPMAHVLAESGNAVIVPDLRGHGTAPERRGDVDHIGQLEEDLADLIDHVSAGAPGKPVVLGGHSSGGGLVVRFAGGDHGAKADAFVLIAPFLKYNAPTTRQNSGGWAFVAIRRIIGLTMLDAVGITALNHLPVIAFAMPRTVLDGPLGHTATTGYSYRLNTSFAPRFDYTSDLEAMDRPLLLVAGEADEAFHADRYQEVIGAHTATGTYVLVPEAGHIGILTDERAISALRDWLETLAPPRG